jgi:hypothetical protein
MLGPASDFGVYCARRRTWRFSQAPGRDRQAGQADSLQRRASLAVTMISCGCRLFHCHGEQRIRPRRMSPPLADDRIPARCVSAGNIPSPPRAARLGRATEASHGMHPSYHHLTGRAHLSRHGAVRLYEGLMRYEPGGASAARRGRANRRGERVSRRSRAGLDTCRPPGAGLSAGGGLRVGRRWSRERFKAETVVQCRKAATTTWAKHARIRANPNS